MTKKVKLKESSTFYKTYITYKNQIKQKLYGMRARCENITNEGYKYYGAKGIEVCASWKAYPEVFICWCIENNYTLGKEIHRLNPHRDYEPENCILCSKEDHTRYHQLLRKSIKEENEEVSNLDENYNYDEQRYYTKTELKTISLIKNLNDEQRDFLFKKIID